MQKKTKDALKIAAITAGVLFMVLPGSFEWAKAKLAGSEADKKKAAEWEKKTQAEFKK